MILALLLGGLVTGCQVAEQDTTEVGEQFQRGISGGGTIVPNDPTSDSFGPEYR